MKKLKINAFLFMGLFFTLISCEKDLDVEPKDERLIKDEAFYRRPGAYKQALAGIYGNLSLTGTSGPSSTFLVGIDAGTSQYGRCLLYLQDLTTDEMVWSYENDPGTADLQRNIWTKSNPILLGMYSRIMVEVAFVNEFLKQSTPEKLAQRGIDASTIAEISTYRSEARVLRAMAYYNMMDLFGKAPFVTENDPLFFKGPEYNRTQLFNFVESELLAVMPSLKIARTNEYGRLDKAVAQMILAKIYLNAEVYIGSPKYAECATQCSNIIASGYVINPNYLNNFKADNETSSEMIFTLQADGRVTQNYGATTVMCNGSVGSLEQNGASIGVSAGGWGGAIRLRKQLVEKFSNSTSFPSDTRNTILGAGRNIEIADLSIQKQGFILRKYSNIKSNGVNGVDATFVDTDFPLFRLSDVYLMYAECAFRGASTATTAQAVIYINEIRDKRGGTVGNRITTGGLTASFLIDERARELHWEAHRRQDLIRFGLYTGGIYNWAWKGNGSVGVSLDSNFKLFPIPENSISANNNLTQNPGYQN